MVEDDELVCAVVVPSLERLGHAVRLCHSADAAQRLLQDEAPSASTCCSPTS